MALTVLLFGRAHAAGGHHDVDDAMVLDTGRCQVEGWGLHARHPGARLVHLGPACRWGPIEWGLTADRLRFDGENADNAGPQAKWATELVPKRLNIGLATGFVKRFHGDTRPLVTTFVPVTVWLGGDNGPLQLHFNLGQDREPALGVMRRWGLAADWSLNDRWVVTAERRKFVGAALTRAGLRFSLTPLSSVDFSYARGPEQRVWVIGFTQEWER